MGNNNSSNSSSSDSDDCDVTCNHINERIDAACATNYHSQNTFPSTSLEFNNTLNIPINEAHIIPSLESDDSIAQNIIPSAPPLESEEIEECPICFDDLERYIITECNHKFHLECIKKINNFKCPLCRYQSLVISNIKSGIYVKEYPEETIACSSVNTDINASTSSSNISDIIADYYECVNPAELFLEHLNQYTRNDINALLDLTIQIEAFIKVIEETEPKLANNIKIRETMINNYLTEYLQHNTSELDKSHHLVNIYKYIENIKNMVQNFINQH